jgi:hypothetical protein
MEELRSTEVLDKEILEDARKKAFKILKTADDTVSSQTQRWEKKTARVLAEIRKAYAQRAQKMKEEILARLPLDKRRLRSQITENFLKEAMADFLKELKREDVFAVLERELMKRLAACAEWEGPEEKFLLLYSAMEKNEAEALVRRISARPGMEHVRGAKPEKWELKKDEGSAFSASFPALVLDARTLRIKVSAEAAAAELLDRKRAELSSGLLGEGVLND